MNYLELRSLLRPVVGDMKDHGPDRLIPELCKSIGLPIPEEGGSKRDRMHAAFDALSDDGLPRFALGLISRGSLTPRTRNAVQDLLWVDQPEVIVTKRQRRDLARSLNRLDRVLRSWEHTKALLTAVFVFEPTFAEFFGREIGKLDWVEKHHFSFPEDANMETLFDELGVFDLSNHRFKYLLEGIVSADVQVDANAQELVVDACNSVLRAHGVELRQMDVEHGYPVYKLISLRAAKGAPKTLIFASAEKPDLRVRDVLNNEVEILSDASKVLVYDRPIVDGLRWRELQSWWADREGVEDGTVAKDALYLRLRGSLPANSPPQMLFFRTYFKTFRDSVHRLPALLPEVWLHWDPVAARQRGPQAFLNHRMDFLMLLPGGRRIVFEVDGKQHYADGDLASPREYARLAVGTRELQLSGYEVYRFGGSELSGEVGEELVARFFRTLFEIHGISPL